MDFGINSLMTIAAITGINRKTNGALPMIFLTINKL